MTSGQPSAPSRALRWFPWAAIAVLLIVRLCHEWFGPDIWYHLALGERIARASDMQPADNLILQQAGFVNVYWLFQLLVRGVFALGGIVGVSVLFIAVWLAAFVFWLRTTGALRSAWGALLALAAVFVCQTRFEERPEIFSYLFLAIQIHQLANWPLDESAQPRSLALFVLVQVLWSNMHGYFVLGPLLVMAKLFSVVLDTPRAEWPRIQAACRGLWLLAALAIVTGFVSPFGLRNWSGVFTLWKFFGAMRHEVQEFMPPTGALLAFWTVKLFWLGWAVVALSALSVLCFAARRDTFAILLAAAGLWLSATSFRNLPLLVFLAAPLGAIVLTRFLEFHLLEKFNALGAGAIGVAALGLAGWAVAGTFDESLAAASSFGIRESPSASPVRFAGYLRTGAFHGTLFNHPADGGYLEFYFPDLRIYGDSRYVEAEPVREYFAALRDPEAFRRLDARHHFDGALFNVNVSRAVVVALAADPNWRLAFADLHRAFLVNRATPAGAAARADTPAFYHGEDLTVPKNGASALQWVFLLAQANDFDDLQRLLRELAAAPRVPSSIIGAALRFALEQRDRDVFLAARALRPKLFSLTPGDEQSIDRLLAQGVVP